MCSLTGISGFANNAILEKLLEAIMGHTEEIRPKDMDMFLDEIVPYASAEIVEEYDTAIFNLLSGQSLLFVDGLDSVHCDGLSFLPGAFCFGAGKRQDAQRIQGWFCGDTDFQCRSHTKENPGSETDD